MIALISLLLLQVTATQPLAEPDRRPAKVQLWDEVQDLAIWIQDQTNSQAKDIEVRAQDPVKCYLMGPDKLVIIVPIHHITARHPMEVNQTEENEAMNVPEPIPTLKEQATRAQIYRENQKRMQAIKEANFEKLVTELKGMVLNIKHKVKPFELPIQLHLIVEECDRLWIASPLKGQIQYQRKVVTLEVDDLLAFDPNSTEIKETRFTRTLKDPGKRRSF